MSRMKRLRALARERRQARRAGVEFRPRRRLRFWQKFLIAWAVLLCASWLVRLTTTPPYLAPKLQDGGERKFVLVPEYDHRGERVAEDPFRLSYFHWPAAEGFTGAPAVLLHGSPGDASGMTRLGQIIHERTGREVLAFDMPGMGRSQGWVESYGDRATAKEIAAALEYLQIPRAHLVGWSWGGVVVTRMADDAPERAASITLLGATVTQEAEGTGDWRFERAKHALGYAFLVVGPEFIPHFGLLGPLASRHAFIRNFWDTDFRPMGDVLRRLDTPTLILHGRDDFLMSAWGAEHHHSLMPDSRLVMTQRGHFLPLGEPFGQAQETASYLEPFFARHDEPGVPPIPGKADFAPVRDSGVTDFGAFEVSRQMHWALVILLIVLATFISEDATVIAVGLAIAHGRIDPFVGLIGCFTGILLGDGGLWLLGRLVGRRAMRWPIIRAWVPPASLDRWGRWFDRHSIAAVFLARAFPGTRVPTYFAAGLLSKRAHGFILWAVLAILIWTPLLLGFVIILGPRVLDAIGSVVSGPLAVVIAIVALLVIYRVVTYAFTWTGRRRLLADVQMIGRPEFWPPWIFYIPLVPWMAYLALRYRGPMTFTCANPGIAHGGGVVGESKIEILRKLERAKGHIVGTAFIAAGKPSDERADEVERLATTDPALGGYPLILKPDEAQRGHGFKVVRNREEAKRYFDSMTRDALLQEYHPGPNEVGVLWKREPGQERGRVFSVTRKIFPVITGDGKRTLERLIWAHPRYRMQADKFLKRYDSERDRVLAKGETMRLAIAGNHCQGTMFVDGADLITPEFERAIDEVATAFEDAGLDFGRFDLRYASDDELRAGRGFKIIELNGTMSESTNLYDPGKPIWWSYAVLLRQWATLYRIGAARRSAGVRPMSLKELVIVARDHYRGRPGSAIAD